MMTKRKSPTPTAMHAAVDNLLHTAAHAMIDLGIIDAKGSRLDAAGSPVAPEPPPSASDKSVDIWPLVIADYTNDQAPILTSQGGVRVQTINLVLTDMAARNEFGIAKYGVPLQSHNGRDALVDAYQEVLDLTAYLRQWQAEYGDLLSVQYGCALGIATRLRGMIEESRAVGERVAELGETL